jgi:hypothetical protein
MKAVGIRHITSDHMHPSVITRHHTYTQLANVTHRIQAIAPTPPLHKKYKRNQLR